MNTKLYSVLVNIIEKDKVKAWLQIVYKSININTYLLVKYYLNTKMLKIDNYDDKQIVKYSIVRLIEDHDLFAFLKITLNGSGAQLTFIIIAIFYFSNLKHQYRRTSFTKAIFDQRRARCFPMQDRGPPLNPDMAKGGKLSHQLSHLSG